MTGAGGFIGRHVCSDLLRRGFSVRALIRDPSSAVSGVDVRLTADPADAQLLRSALRGANALIHLAGRAHVMSDSSGDEMYRLVNVEGTRMLAKAAAAESIGHVIFSSSVKAIGEGGPAPLTDDTPESPKDAYGRSKLEAERVLLEVCDREQITATILRFPVVYGPGVKGNVRRLFDAVWRGLPIPVGGIRNSRSMLGVENLLAFIGSALERSPANHRPFLLSDKEAVSTEDLLRMIGSGLSRPARVIRVPLTLLRAVAATGDAIACFGIPALTSAQIDRLVGSLIVDSSRAWRAAAMSPPVSLEVGIAHTAAWYLGTRRTRRT